LRRLFQSKATLSAFSTASAPPSTKNRCGRPGSPSTRAKVSTKRAIGDAVDVGVARLVQRRLEQLLAEQRVVGQRGWFMPSAEEAKKVNRSR
jgi:hypothetical protein